MIELGDVVRNKEVLGKVTSVCHRTRGKDRKLLSMRVRVNGTSRQISDIEDWVVVNLEEQLAVGRLVHYATRLEVEGDFAVKFAINCLCSGNASIAADVFEEVHNQTFGVDYEG